MKQLVLGFEQFVNESFDLSTVSNKKSACCKAELMEDGSCSECGKFENDETSEESDELTN